MIVDDDNNKQDIAAARQLLRSGMGNPRPVRALLHVLTTEISIQPCLLQKASWWPMYTKSSIQTTT